MNEEHEKQKKLGRNASTLSVVMSHKLRQLSQGLQLSAKDLPRLLPKTFSLANCPKSAVTRHAPNVLIQADRSGSDPYPSTARTAAPTLVPMPAAAAGKPCTQHSFDVMEHHQQHQNRVLSGRLSMLLPKV